jgi:hypothetical protein
VNAQKTNFGRVLPIARDPTSGTSSALAVTIEALSPRRLLYEGNMAVIER